MKQKKDNTKSIVFSNDESTEILFEKIKGWEITSQVMFAVSFDNPKRKELFEKIFEAVTNETVKQNIFLIVQRIQQAAFQVSGYTPSEIEYYQSLFAKDFYIVLHSDNYQTYIEDKIRELLFYCNGLEQDLRTKKYKYVDDRGQDKIKYSEADRYRFYLEKLLVHLNTLPPQQTETKTQQETIEIKPVFKPEAVQIVFDIIKDFFSLEQQTELKQVIITGNKASKKLLFKGRGNRLTDTFKKLIEHDFITSCQKQDLINWIISNFNFTQQNKVKEFIYDTVEKTISRNDQPCKSPLIEITNNQIQKISKPHTKSIRKY